MLPIADANILLRYILNDDTFQHDRAKKLIKDGCETTPEVLSEVAYVLHGHYEFPREETGEAMLRLIEEVHMEQQDEVSCALNLYGEHNLDFVDCMLAAKHIVSGRRIVTFDKKLLRLVA